MAELTFLRKTTLCVGLVLVLFTAGALGRLKCSPGDQKTSPGIEVKLNCSTESLAAVDWQFRRTEDGEPVIVFIGKAGGGGDMSNDFRTRSRYRVEVDIASGRYDLVLRNVTKADEGLYTCTDISNPDESATVRLSVSGAEDASSEFCSNGVAAAAGVPVHLNFTTTQTDSIHIEHRSLDRSYPLHVFRDWRIVNDYYVLSGRFSVDTSVRGSLMLAIQDVQPSDAGTYVFSEDNGLGKQYSLELIVIENGDDNPELKCEQQPNLECTVKFFGHCPPRMELRKIADGKSKMLISNVTISANRLISSVKLPREEQQKEAAAFYCDVLTQSGSRFSSQQLCFTALGDGPRPHIAQQETVQVSPKVAVVLVCAMAVITIVVLGVVIVRRRREINRSLRLNCPILCYKNPPSKAIHTADVKQRDPNVSHTTPSKPNGKDDLMNTRQETHVIKPSSGRSDDRTPVKEIALSLSYSDQRKHVSMSRGSSYCSVAMNDQDTPESSATKGRVAANGTTPRKRKIHTPASTSELQQKTVNAPGPGRRLFDDNAH